MSALSDAWAKLATALGVNKATLAAATTAVNTSKTQAQQIKDLQAAIAAKDATIADLNAQLAATADKINATAADVIATTTELAALLKVPMPA
jgi:uncharacterized coiled-coil protein SlyX